MSHHIRRVGYHFRSDILDEAMNWLGYQYHKGRLVRDTGAASSSGFERSLARYGSRFDKVNERSDIEGPTKVKDAVRELFPNIPDEDLEQILERAWATVGDFTFLSILTLLIYIGRRHRR